MKSITTKRLIIFVCTLAPMTLLMMALWAPKSGIPSPAHVQAASQKLTGPCRVAGPGCKIAGNLHRVDPIVIHDILTTAISIAERF
jgi:hypothetical protein